MYNSSSLSVCSDGMRGINAMFVFLKNKFVANNTTVAQTKKMTCLQDQQDLSVKVQLFLECKNLINLDLLSKSDAVVIAYEFRNNDWVKIGTTEVINDNLNPKFKTSISLSYYFEKVQKWVPNFFALTYKGCALM